MSSEEENRLIARADRRIRKAKEALAYSESVLGRMYWIRERLAIAEEVAGQLLTKIKSENRQAVSTS
jgi:hypothetical protein